MSEKHFVGRDLTGFQDSGQTAPVSRVTLLLDDENAVTAGDDSGLELSAQCPHATQAMAEAILKRVKGYSFQTLEAQGARLDPASELGDGVTACGAYGVLGVLRDDGTGYPDLTAPGQGELEEEFPMEGPATQAFDRKLAATRSQISKTAEEIRLEIVDEVKDASAAFDLKLDGLSTSFSNKLTQQSASFDVKLNGLSSSFTDQLNGLSASFDVRFEGLSASFEDKLGQQAASFDVKLNGLSASFSDGLQGLKSEFSTGLDGLKSRLTSAEGSMSELTQTLEGFEARVESAEGAISQVRLTAEGLSSTVEDAEGRLTTLEQTAKSITSRVDGLDGSYSQLSQTVSGFEATVSDLESGLGQTVRLGADGVTITNAKGSKLTIDGGQIRAETLDLTGCITFSDLDKDTQERVSETGISEARAKTLITSTLVSSPRIEGADIYGGTFHDANGLGNFKLVWDTDRPGIDFETADGKPIFQVVYLQGGNVDAYGGIISMAGVPFLSTVGVKLGATTTLVTTASGNWVFTGAVSGVNSLELEDEIAAQPGTQGDPGLEGPGTGEPIKAKKVKISDKNGKMCMETDGVTWVLDANGLHRQEE